MGGRSPVRFVAPLALLLAAIALLVVVMNATREDRADTAAAAKQERTGEPARKRKGRKRYTVKAGDTPSGIAEKVGVPLQRILDLNPELDPQSITPGTKIKLR